MEGLQPHAKPSPLGQAAGVWRGAAFPSHPPFPALAEASRPPIHWCSIIKPQVSRDFCISEALIFEKNALPLLCDWEEGMAVLQVMVSCHFHLRAVGKRLLVGKHQAAESATPLSPRFVKQLPRSAVVLEELNIYTSLFCKPRASEVSGIVSATRAAPRAGCLSEPLLDLLCQTLLPGHLRQHGSLPHTHHGQH